MEKEPILESRKFHKVWVEQCEAAKEIKRRYGLRAAFDYLVAEKLLNFADAATTHPEFARELPRFVAGVRGWFTVEEMRAHLKRIELAQREHEAYISGHDEFDEQDEQWRRTRSPSKALRPLRSARDNSLHCRIIDRCRAWDILKARARGSTPFRPVRPALRAAFR